jgi:hypothetical protein
LKLIRTDKKAKYRTLLWPQGQSTIRWRLFWVLERQWCDNGKAATEQAIFAVIEVLSVKIFVTMCLIHMEIYS